jgi:sensor histidine kinase YesM
MKQLLFLLILILFRLSALHAQETNPIEDTSWNVIRERLFSGENSKAFRFEDDIRFQLKGEVSKEDSFAMQNIVYELKKLIEVVDVKLVNENANFIFTIYPPENGTSSSRRVTVFNNAISNVAIELNSKLISNESEKGKFFTYHSLFNLTKTFEPRNGRTGYFGIFDSQDFQQSGTIHEIDKNLIRKLYSKDFYKQLKKNTVKKWGYLYYLNLRFEIWVKKISTTICIILIITGFLYLLSNDNSNRSKTFWNYQIRGFQILLWILVCYLILELPAIIPFGTKSHLWGIVFAKIIEVFIFGTVSIILMFFVEHLFLNRIASFFHKQIFILFTSFSVIILSYFFIALPFIYLNLKSQSGYLAFSQLINSSMVFYILVVATLRVLYNFIKYKIQSIVNQKDVELAKMKELKNQAELNALHSRINPHFLYNSLNSIASLAHINPDKTENMATALSELFRYSINKEDKTFVTVEEELEMVKKYLEIEKTRFGDKLIYSIEADENVKEKLIPKFLIQPLAENAIKHGLSKIKEVGKITISVKQLENDLAITIFDNGPDFPEEPVSGYGLQNLNDKLEIIYGKNALINWENGDNKHFKITIKNQF